MSYGLIRKAEISLSAEKFSMDEFTDSTGAKNYLGFSKIVPSVKLIFKNKNATSSVKKWLAMENLFYSAKLLCHFKETPCLQQDVITYPKSNRYLNQLNFALENNRALYPYSSNIVAQQANNFLRFSFEGKYFFNYPKGGGMNARFICRKIYVFGSQNNL